MAVALDQFVKQIEDSGVLSAGTLEKFVPPQAQPKDAQALARQLVKQKHLTRFQAQQIYQGKAKALILGNYTILDKIGAGGMGQVFKAEHRRMKRIVAIKMLPASMTKDAAAAARFQREVEAAAKLRHTNVVAADDADEANGVHFLVMEYVEGSDLSARVKQNGPFSVHQAVNCILQAARGLEYAHGKGVIHRDIKPANLLLDTEGTVKILDMGLARIESNVDTPTQAELTGTGAVMGTVDYMAPEQALSTKDADARADIYSLGCSLYYLLSGNPTYDGDTVMARLLAHREGPIPSLADVQADVPAELQAVFEKMVAKKPEDRYQSMTDVIAALESCGTQQETLVKSEEVTASVSRAGLTSLLEKTSATPPADTLRTSIASAQPVAAGPRRSHKTAVMIGAAVLGALILAGVIISLQTKDGTLIVEVDQPDVTVQVLNSEDEVEIIQKGGQGKISIGVDPGKHRLKVEKDGFAVFGQEFEIESGGKKTITAKMVAVKASNAKDAKPIARDPVRRAAEWVIARGGSVELSINDQNRKLGVGEPLPSAAFKLTAIHLNNDVLSDADLENISNLPDVAWVDLKGTQITDARLSHLGGLPGLKKLWLWNTNISDAGVQDLVGIETLTFLGLDGTQVTDVGLLSIAKMDTLTGICLRNEHVTPAGVARLKAALPKCSILWNAPDSEKSPIPSANSNPPQGAANFQGHKYQFFPEVLTWHQAKTRCEEMGGRLAVITSAAENNFVVNLAKKEISQLRNEGVWLGATDEQKEGDWRWIDGTVMDFNVWGPKQPNNKDNNEHYLLLLLPQSEWSDQPDKSMQHKAYFVCEWDDPAR